METFAEGLATRVAFELPQRIMREHLDDFMLVSDGEIRSAIVTMIETTRNLVEAAGAASLAGALNLRERLAGKRVALICSGGNISPRAARRRPRGRVAPCRPTAPLPGGYASSVASSGSSTSSSAWARCSPTPTTRSASRSGRRRCWVEARSSSTASSGAASRFSTRLVVFGALLGLVATAWTLIVPVLADRARRAHVQQRAARPGGAVRITGVRTFVVGNPTPGYGGRYFIFLKLETRRRHRGPRRGLRRDRLAAARRRA